MNTAPAPTRLSPDEETTLAKLVEAGVLAAAMLDPTDPTEATLAADDLVALVNQGEQARERLALANLGLVHVIATELARRSRVSRADLYQEGCLALELALMRYDFRQGRLAPYIGSYLRWQMRQAAFRSERHCPVADTDYVIARLSDETVDSTEFDGTREALAQGLGRLPPAERNVLGLRHGWDGGQPATLRQVADRLDLSLSKVRRLEQSGLTRLRAYWSEIAA
ncbi:MAG: sigma-70 family RNA polymerase sigma factor [Propionibacteriaceae bacterium]|jgi:RNA polymerase sigma factor (sigma-70 family)|nr:sigma-70 family RNA polymerase sigma factor [Propionibacteriaceae bacterium]